MISAQNLKATLSMQELLAFHGIDIPTSRKILCPFHDERTPSCHVYEDSFYCFGCGVGGDIITFEMMYSGISFRQALIRLSNLAGITVDSLPPAMGHTERKRRRDNAAADAELNHLAVEHRHLVHDLHVFKPHTPFDFVHERYVCALTNINSVKYDLNRKDVNI